MPTTKSTSHVTLKNRDTSVMKGIDKHITTSFTIAGTTYTPAELKALFQSEITAIEASDAMRKWRGRRCRPRRPSPPSLPQAR